ncbi:hypothetical protein [Microbacterium sp.]|uniref:hypothetical protein n=1 Tax=Microbacterium sp. TaxID=51671 RepID=UPI003A8CDA8F
MTATIIGHPFSLETARSFIPNPSFESTALNWVASSGAPGLLIQAGFAFVGTNSLRVTNGGSGQNVALHDKIPVTAGRPYTYVARALARDVATWVRVALRFLDAAGAQIGALTYGGAVQSNANYVLLSYTQVAPAGAVSVQPVIRQDGDPGQRTYWDAMMLVESAVVPTDYFDGDTPSTATVEYRWLGASNGSASVQLTKSAADIITPDLVLAPWQAAAESMSTIHPYMDRPSWAVATWREPGPRQGSLDLMFDTAADAAVARSVLAGHRWFEFDDTDYRWIDPFILTPGQQLTHGQSPDAPWGRGDTGPAWHVVVPWTEVSV